MTLSIVTHIVCDDPGCVTKVAVPIGVTVEHQRTVLRKKGWRRLAMVPASRSGPALGGKDFCPKHAKSIGSAQ